MLHNFKDTDLAITLALETLTHECAEYKNVVGKATVFIGRGDYDNQGCPKSIVLMIPDNTVQENESPLCGALSDHEGTAHVCDRPVNHVRAHSDGWLNWVGDGEHNV